MLDEPTSDDGWTLHSFGFNPLTERGVEAAFAVENGHFGVRAALEEGSSASNPLIIVAGEYVATEGSAGQTLLTLPDPADLKLVLDGAPVHVPTMSTVEQVRVLDMRLAEMRRSWTFSDASGRLWRLSSMRAASAADAVVYLHRFALTLEAGTASRVSLRFQIAADPPASGSAGPMPIELPAVASGSLESRTHVARRLFGSWSIDHAGAHTLLTAGQEVGVESVTMVHTDASPDAAEFARAIERHAASWDGRWRNATITIGGHDGLNRAARFATYHLLGAGSECEGRWSIGARNLSGEGYHGHVFWDTDIFILPALMLTRPAAARSLLLYRHRTLPAARERARKLGYEGALFAWESTDTGEDRTPPAAVLPSGKTQSILTGEQEHHIAGDVPYAVIQYWRATGDDDFMHQAGAEIVFECARFWNSRVTSVDHEDSIRKVIGPDEFHESVNNDAYTNAMARWTLEAAVALTQDATMRGLVAALEITQGAIVEWATTARRLTRSRFTEGDVVPQFDGFLSLKDADVHSYRDARIPIDIALGFDAMQHLRALKQADVLMSAALLPDIWTESGLRTNFAFYEPRTAHTSSLSPPVHALIAAWLRDPELTVRYLEQTAAIDLADNFAGASGGVHLGALGGLWQAVVFGLAGIKFDAQGIAFDPFLPPPITDLSLSFIWRRRHVHVRIGERLRVRVDGERASVRVNHDRRQVSGAAEFSFDPAMTYWAATQEER